MHITTPRAIASIIAVASTAALIPTIAGGQQPPPGTTPPVAAPGTAPPPVAAPSPTVVKTTVRKPQRVMRLRSSFHPPAYPSAWYVFHVIVPHEAARWGAPAGRLACRITGESGGSWRATNGQYQSVGQFAKETFYRGVASIGSRRVTMVQTRHRIRRTRIVRLMSDGTVQRDLGRRIRQRIEHRKVGTLPRNPPRRHAWTQVRIMARAFVGLGRVNDSEWEVRC